MNRTAAQVDLIWKHTADDYRLLSHGVRKVMYPAPYCALGPIEDLPDEAFERCLEYAQRKECREKRDVALLPIMQKHGMLEHFNGTNQWRDTLEDVREYAGFVLKGEKLDSLILDVQRSGVVFPG